jgi:hypothetical protein
MMKKINHPYLVPDDFFENLEEELQKTINAEPEQSRMKEFILTISKYAAIIILSFILGRISVSFHQNRVTSSYKQNRLSPELILSQFSEDDITNYIIENVNEDVFQ